MSASDLNPSFADHFLVALSGTGLAQDYFHDSISLLVEHNADGAFGLVINRPLDTSLAELLPGFATAGAKHQLAGQRAACRVLEGGPVEPNRLFFLHSAEREYPGTLKVNADIYLSTATELVEELRHDAGPAQIVALLGYAGWGAEQLEQELAQTIWLLTPTDADIVFTTPMAERRSRAAAILGVDLNLINRAAGHD